MITVIFTFADGDSMRNFNSTFDAFYEVINAYNMCEDYFVGARLATSKKAEYIDLLEAEAYVKQVAPVRDYLEYAVLAGFELDEICEDIKRMHLISVSRVLDSWKQHMKEYSDAYDD